jgi:uncharacterized protein YndB with AHSA1/START domain
MSDQSTSPWYALEDENVIVRTFAAPRERVFQAWTEADWLARWWYPAGGSVEVHRLELRPGGLFHYAQQLPGGPQQWGRFTYREITAPERLVYVSAFSDAAGALVRAPWSPTWPAELLNVLTLSEQQGQTTLELRGGPINASAAERATFAAARPMLAQGFAPFFARLDELLAEEVPKR